MSISKYNQGPQFEINFDGKEWKTLEDLYNEKEGKIFVLEGLFINQKSKFGPRPYAATTKYLVDFPQHLLEVVQEILTDQEIIQQIRDRKAGFTVRAYMSKTYNRECYTPDFVDL